MVMTQDEKWISKYKEAKEERLGKFKELLVSSCKAMGVNPREWMEDVMVRFLGGCVFLGRFLISG